MLQESVHSAPMAQFMFLFMFLLLPLSQASPETEEAVLGQNATLTCRTDVTDIMLVKWTRPDLQNNGYVLFYREGRLLPHYQHSSFRDRVELVTNDLKSGDVSLILKNVTHSDAGTYECRVSQGRSRPKRAITDPLIKRINLVVTGPQSGNAADTNAADRNAADGHQTHHHVGLAVTVAAVALVGLVAAVFIRSRRQRPVAMNPSAPAAGEETDEFV